MDEPFAPPGASWVRVSPKWRTVRLVSSAAFWGSVALVGLVLWIFTIWWIGAAVVLVAVVSLGLAAWMVPRQVAAIGYDIGADALTIRKGLLYRQLVVVPYARMQYVDVQAGPLMRRYDIAAVQLHTASAATDALIPGLDATAAAELRDELARLGETKSVGL